MAYPSVTYTFSNSTTADASQVNQNLTDLVNGASDGTKDYNIAALTCAGTATLNGAVTLGNASGDDITVTGSLASSIPIKTTFSYDIGSATLGLRYIFLGSNDSAARSVKLSAGAVTSSYTITFPAAVPTVANCVAEFDTSATMSFTPRSNRATTSIANSDSPYTATTATEVLLCNATAGAITVNLPAAASSSKKVIVIKKTDSSTNAVTIDGNSSETIDGATTKKLATQYEQLTIVCDGSNWHVIERWHNQTWTSFTPTGSWSANTTYTGFWRRVGDSMQIQIKVALSGAPTAAQLTLSMPSGYTVDEAKATANALMPGVWVGLDSGTANLAGHVFYDSAADLFIPYLHNTAGGITATAPITWANGDYLTIMVTVPITGWEG